MEDNVPRLLTDRQLIKDTVARWLLIGLLPGLPLMVWGMAKMAYVPTFTPDALLGLALFALGGGWAGATLLVYVKACGDYLRG